MNNLSIICCLAFLALNVGCRAAPCDEPHNDDIHTTDQEEHDYHNNDELVHQETNTSTEDLEEHPVVKRSTDAELSSIPIDWKSLIETVLVVIQKFYHWILAAFTKFFLSYSAKVTSLFKEVMLPVFVPFYSSLVGRQSSATVPAAVTSTSVDWRSAANALFDTLSKFHSLQTNKIL